MAANPWKAPLEKAIQGNEDNFVNKCMQLATVREDGRPTCRTLLFRGLVGPTDAIAFYGDRRCVEETLTQLFARQQLVAPTSCRRAWRLFCSQPAAGAAGPYGASSRPLAHLWKACASLCRTRKVQEIAKNSWGEIAW